MLNLQSFHAAPKEGLVMRRCWYGYMVLFFVGFLHASALAADRIRIGFPDLAATFVPLAIADKRGFFTKKEFRPNPSE
jgi:hypothetical protein